MESERLEALLRAEREVCPDPGAERRIWSAVEHRLAHGPPPPAGAELAPAGLGGAAGGTTLKLLAGLALVVTAVGVMSMRGPAEAPALAVERAVERVDPAPPGSHLLNLKIDEPARSDIPEPPSPEPVAARVVDEPVPEEPPAGDVRARPRARPRVVAPAKQPEQPVADDFAAELQLIGEIGRAIKRGDSARALERVAEHARRFGAGGQLVQERLAYHVEALCAAGRVDDARRVAGELLTRWPDSTHAPRVKSGCAGA